MLNHCLIILSVILLPCSVFAQEKSQDIAAITTTIENYFDGYVERDIDKLNKAFDTQNGAMKVLTKADDGTESAENHLFKDLMPKWGAREKLSTAEKNNCALHILNIDVVDGKIGAAKISMKIGDTTYIDILSLQKMNGDWKITNKIYVVLEK